MRYLCILGLIATFGLAGLPAQAQDRYGTLTSVESKKPMSFAAIRNSPGLIALTFLGYEKEYLATAKRTILLAPGKLRGLAPPWVANPTPDGPTGDVLDFYRREGDRFFRVAHSEPGYIFLGMLSEYGEGADRLITTWETGTARAMVIFARRNNRIEKVFEWAGHVVPEFIDLANNGTLYLVATDGDIYTTGGKTTYPETAAIYAWEGSQYVLKKKVPWWTRFDAFKEEWPQRESK